jgi:hypothetical protein
MDKEFARAFYDGRPWRMLTEIDNSIGCMKNQRA